MALSPPRSLLVAAAAFFFSLSSSPSIALADDRSDADLAKELLESKRDAEASARETFEWATDRAWAAVRNSGGLSAEELSRHEAECAEQFRLVEEYGDEMPEGYTVEVCIEANWRIDADAEVQETVSELRDRFIREKMQGDLKQLLDKLPEVFDCEKFPDICDAVDETQAQ